MQFLYMKWKEEDHWKLLSSQTVRTGISIVKMTLNWMPHCVAGKEYIRKVDIFWRQQTWSIYYEYTSHNFFFLKKKNKWNYIFEDKKNTHTQKPITMILLDLVFLPKMCWVYWFPAYQQIEKIRMNINSLKMWFCNDYCHYCKV